MSGKFRIEYPKDSLYKLATYGIRAKSFINKFSNTVTKHLAEQFYDFTREKLKEGQLGLQKLNRKTIAKKRAKGLDNPSAPMYGLGENDNRSFYNLIEIDSRPSKKFSRTKTFEVGFSAKARHHSGKKIALLNRYYSEGNDARNLPPRDIIKNSKNRFKRTMSKRKLEAFNVAKLQTKWPKRVGG